MKRKNNNALSPKPFVIQNDADERKVYLPERTVTLVKNPVTQKKERVCSCVHVCDQFLTYPVIEWGIRYIPTGTLCKYCFGQKCYGNLLFKDGKASEEINVPYILKNNLIRPDSQKEY